MPPLAPGQVRLRIERFALTANTVTYATTGEPARLLGLLPDRRAGLGLCAGHGLGGGRRVAAPRRIDRGRSLLRLVPDGALRRHDRHADHGRLRDEGAASCRPCSRVSRLHGDDPRSRCTRQGPTPRIAMRCCADCSSPAGSPKTYFADNDWFGARRVLVLSASSKTAIGFAHCADARAGIEVIGVTSARNHAFTHALGCYDEVVTYDECAAIPRGTPIVSIDMAGSGPVLASVHSHFGDQFRHSMAIGRSHHEARPPRVPGMPGPEAGVLLRADAGQEARAGLGSARLPGTRRHGACTASSRGVAAGCTCSIRAARRPRRRRGAKSMRAGWRPTSGTSSRSGTE